MYPCFILTISFYYENLILKLKNILVLTYFLNKKQSVRKLTNLPLHIRMVFFTLGPDLYYFFFPQNLSYQLNIISLYKLMNLSMSNQYGTLSVHPIVLFLNKVSPNPQIKIFLSFTMLENTPYMKTTLFTNNTCLTWSTISVKDSRYHFIRLPMVKFKARSWYHL